MTPAVKTLERDGVAFRLHEYAEAEYGDGDYAVAVAHELGVEPARVFKTLVASVDGDLRVFVVPADHNLDLRAVGKRAEMADRTAAERATGYVAGGISPLGQRKRLPTAVDDTALGFETIFVSAGRRGLQIELAPGELVRLTAADVRPLTLRG